jgi:hypothetical protein
MRVILILISILFMIFSKNAYAETRIIKIYAVGKTDAPPLFNQRTEIEETESGITHETATITDPSGKVVLTEDTNYKDEQLIHQLVKNFQTNEAYEASVASGKVTFKSYKIQGDKLIAADPEKSEILNEEFITGPLLEFFVRKHWNEIQGGDTVHVRFGVLEISESVGFKFWEVARPVVKGQTLVDIRMKAASIFIAMAVAPIDLFFDPIQKKMVRYIGRTPLKVLSDRKWIPLDAEITYQ